MKYVALHLHTNLWYAEYTHEEVIRRFPYVYRQILDVLEKYPEIKVSWDVEPSISIPYLQEVAPDVLIRTKKGVQEKQFEILVDTWSFSLVSLHTLEEFEYQYKKAIKTLKDMFGVVSNGFFAQETAYSETLPKLLSSHGIKFLPLRKETIEMLASGDFNSNFLTTYTLKGYDNSKIIAVPFETVYSNLTAFIEEKRKSLDDESVILLLGDTEIFSPKELERLGKYLRNHRDTLKPILLSEYVETHPPVGEIYLPDCTWSYGTNDYFLWCRDPWDQHLWTLNERARHKFSLVKFWLSVMHNNEKKRWQSKLNDILDLILLGQNSDKFGWNPCPEKRKEGEVEFLNAFYRLESLSSLLSEKIFQEAPEEYKIYGKHVKHFMLVSQVHANNSYTHLPLPLTIPIKLEKQNLKLDEFALFHESQKIPFVLHDIRYDEEFIKSGDLIVLIQDRLFNNVFSHLFVHRDKPLYNASSLGDFLADLSIKDNYATVFKNKSDDIQLSGELFGYEILLDTDSDLELISRDISVEKSTPSDLFVAYKIAEKFNHAAVLTEFRVYRGTPLLEIIRKFTFNTKVPGRLNPVTVLPDKVKFEEIVREIHDTIVKRDLRDVEEVTPLINDWGIIKTSDAELFFAADSLIHSVKEVNIEENKLTFSPIETIYEDNPYEHLYGDYVFKMLFGVFPLGTSDNLLINTAKLYSKPIHVIDMLQSEGARGV